MRRLKITASITQRDEEEALSVYMAEIAKMDPLTSDEEAELARRIKQGDRAAIDRLICSNLRFVISVAKNYQHQGLSLADLIEEGNIGLIKAAERFDETRGFRFISYAVNWIRQSILEALESNRTMIRLPHSQTQLASRVRRVRNEIEQRECRPATAEEIADELDMPTDKIQTLLSAMEKTTSLDETLSEDSDSTLLDVHDWADTVPADDGLEQESRQQQLDLILKATLQERDAMIVRMYYGVGCEPVSQEELGRMLGLSRERVRQICEEAVRKMRRMTAAGWLYSA